MNSKEYRIEYLLGLLNSRYLNHLYHELVHEKGRVFAHIKLSKLAQLPIRMIDFSDPTDKVLRDRVVELVEHATKIARQQRAVRTQQSSTILMREREAVQHQLDATVQQLYGLTEAETAAMEGGQLVEALKNGTKNIRPTV